ncbi:phage gp6-like head-tail connector protein [Escherichia coli]|nr:phage gp6-like head-tail connector protein [Escherichia coli]EFC5347120.1 phage gp6-like head-tail connector protein [Escherichia coli]EGM6340154.1 phage gp6-like head-tail connector protein [Escherichia coli]EIH2566531.1 phage gp6-like head-tail connector protein [Escherichia coli]ELN5804047.1 phage gp6-like head-tail connector protein [Escherichia coli]
MSEEKITPDAVRAHLRLDDFSGEGELLKMYTDAALEACQKHIGKRFEDGLEFTPAMRVGCLMYIAFLYENREAVSPVEQSELPMAISALWSVYRDVGVY